MRQSCRTALFPLLLLSAACQRRANLPPPAEFLLAAGDSAFWVTSDAQGLHMRAAPLDIAQIGGRFVEFYVVDDERSFQGADLIGQSVYRRDLQTGDSVRVFTDSIVPALAREYARAHPDDSPIGPEDEPDDDPAIRATATLELGEAHGAFVSYSLHTDVERPGSVEWHTSRRGVLDLRSAHSATLGDVAGSDSSELLKRASAEAQIRLDPASFSITTIEGQPALAFAVPGSGAGDAGRIRAVFPVLMSRPSWWTEVATSLPQTSSGGNRKVWRHGDYTVVVRYDASGGAELAIRNRTSREWLVGPVSTPAARIYWLDKSGVSPAIRQALEKAFNNALSYDGETLVAMR